MNKKPMDEETKNIIKKALDDGMSFDEAMEKIERTNSDDDYAEISYSTVKGTGYIFGNVDEAANGILILINQFLDALNNDPERKQHVIRDINELMMKQTLGMLKANGVPMAQIMEVLSEDE